MLTSSYLAIGCFRGWNCWHDQNLPENDGWTPVAETAEFPLLPEFSFANLPINKRCLGCRGKITKILLELLQGMASSRRVALRCSFATFGPTGMYRGTPMAFNRTQAAARSNQTLTYRGIRYSR